MEFTYYPELNKWKHDTVQDSKTSASVPSTSSYRLRLPSGLTIDIPNFHTTFLTFIQTKFPSYWQELKNVEFYYTNGLIPWFENVFEPQNIIHRHPSYQCNIFDARWNDTGFNNGYSDAMVIVLARETRFLHQRMQKMEHIFDHIRQKNSTLDEFIKTAEEVIKRQSRNAKKKRSRRNKKKSTSVNPNL